MVGGLADGDGLVHRIGGVLQLLISTLSRRLTQCAGLTAVQVQGVAAGPRWGPGQAWRVRARPGVAAGGAGIFAARAASEGVEGSSMPCRRSKTVPSFQVKRRRRSMDCAVAQHWMK